MNLTKKKTNHHVPTCEETFLMVSCPVEPKPDEAESADDDDDDDDDEASLSLLTMLMPKRTG